MKLYSLPTLVNIAKTKTLYYKNLYHNISDDDYKLESLPVVDIDTFWMHDPIKNKNHIFTDKISDGFIFASSGSTGLPKYTAFSKQEWISFSQAMGQLLWKSKLIENGDIVANLASVGDLLSSFLTVHDGLLSSIADCVELPLSISNTTTTEGIVNTCRYLNANAVIGLSFNLIDIAYFVKKNKIKDLNFNKIIYGGETLHNFQLKLLQEAFPDAMISTCVYSSNDAGLMGYWDQSCAHNELRSCEPYTKIEIIDEHTKELIHEPLKEGIILATNFTKILMPTIRYPVGDKGMWLEGDRPNRKFILTNRTKKTEVIVENVAISIINLINIVNKLPSELAISRFQLEVDLMNGKSQLLLKLGWTEFKQFTTHDIKNVENAIYEEIPQLLNLINEDKIRPIQIIFIELDKIKANVGPGKHKQIIDNRSP